MNTPEYIDDLIVAFCAGTIKEEEKRELNAWVEASPEHASRFQKSVREYKRLQLSLNDGKNSAEMEYSWNHLTNALRKRQGKRLRRWVGYAASVLLLSAGVFLYLNSHREYPPLLSAGPELADRVILTTAGGDIMGIDHIQTFSGMNASGRFQLHDSLSELIYRVGDGKAEAAGYHQLDVLRGAEYKLRLEDGTRVLLNSGSYIRFPEQFGTDRREIEISGEVYLDVVPDKDRPFIVRTGSLVTEVLGTRFGIRAYPDEAVWSAVLAQGRIKVNYGEQTVTLEPGQQAVLKDKQLTEEPADVDKALAWTNGIFIFEHDALENVLSGLARWYGVDFVFEDNSLKTELFTGEMSRDMPIEEILVLIEKVNVIGFEKTGNTYTVKNKRQNWN